MRILTVLVVLIAVLGGGYYVYWHKKADEFKQMFVQSTDALNANAKPFTKDLDFVHYDSVSVTGFPSAMVLEVHKPVVNLPVSAAMQLRGTGAALPYEWVEQVSWGDKVTFTGNISGNRFTFSTNGDRKNKTLMNNTVRHNVDSISSTPLVCNLDLKKINGGSIWAMQPIFSDPKVFADNFESFDCSVKGLSYKDASGNLLASLDEFSISTGNEATGAGGNHKIAFHMNLDKLKATPAFDAVGYDYMLMLYTLMGNADQLGSSFPVSEYGEQSALIDILYDGPSDDTGLAAPDLNAHFDINHFDFHSGVSNMTVALHAATAPQGNERTLSFTYHTNVDISQKGDELSKKHFTEMLTAMKKNASKTVSMDPGTQFFQKLSTLGEPAAVVEKLYPNTHALGNMVFDIVFNLKGPNQGPMLFQQGSATLDNFDVLTTPYGVKSKGSANASVPGKPPAGDLSVTCIACDAMVTDAGNYAMRVESVIDQLSTPPKAPYVSTGLIDGVKQFLHGISENPSATDLVIHFVARDTGEYTISGKQLPEVQAQFATTIAPHIPQQSPAAGGQPDAPMPNGSGAPGQ